MSARRADTWTAHLCGTGQHFYMNYLQTPEALSSIATILLTPSDILRNPDMGGALALRNI